jgi:HAD superfamily hydrolase (TIGR01549 family)
LNDISAEDDFSWVKAIILDLDGTLYSQRKLRVRMLIELLARTLTTGPKVLRIIRSFRKVRETLASSTAKNVHELQYSLVAERLGLSIEEVMAQIEEWMYRRPLRHLKGARYNGVVEFVDWRRAAGTKVAVLSDYPVDEKLAALEIIADISYFTLQEPAGLLKPSPYGLRALLAKLEVEPAECLLIGDRIDRDGACADAVGIRFLLCDKSDLFVRLRNSRWHRTQSSNG